MTIKPKWRRKRTRGREERMTGMRRSVVKRRHLKEEPVGKRKERRREEEEEGKKISAMLMSDVCGSANKRIEGIIVTGRS